MFEGFGLCKPFKPYEAFKTFEPVPIGAYVTGGLAAFACDEWCANSSNSSDAWRDSDEQNYSDRYIIHSCSLPYVIYYSILNVLCSPPCSAPCAFPCSPPSSPPFSPMLMITRNCLRQSCIFWKMCAGVFCVKLALEVSSEGGAPALVLLLLLLL